MKNVLFWNQDVLCVERARRAVESLTLALLGLYKHWAFMVMKLLGSRFYILQLEIRARVR